MGSPLVIAAPGRTLILQACISHLVSPAALFLTFPRVTKDMSYPSGCDSHLFGLEMEATRKPHIWESGGGRERFKE